MTGICSADSPHLADLPPLLRDFHGRPDRLPLNDSRMNVSSPSTMPLKAFGLSPDSAARNLCRQRHGVVGCTSQRCAACAKLTPSIMASVCAVHLSFMRNFANGVFVSALKVRRQA